MLVYKWLKGYPTRMLGIRLNKINRNSVGAGGGVAGSRTGRDLGFKTGGFAVISRDLSLLFFLALFLFSFPLCVQRYQPLVFYKLGVFSTKHT
jgi:hypothetical protein